MSISDKIQRLEIAKENIASAIESKGGAVAEGDGFEEFSNDILEIPASGVEITETYTTGGPPFRPVLESANISLSGSVVAHIPSDIVVIDNNAFQDNIIVTRVEFPNSVISIEDGDGTSLNRGAFAGCKNLSEIMLSPNLETIGRYAFLHCAMQNIVIPSSVVAINDYAFFECFALTDIYYIGTEEQWNQISIGADAIPQSVTIHYNY